MPSDHYHGDDDEATTRKPWVKLWRDVTPSFESMPVVLRGFADEILRVTDDAGYVGTIEDGSTLAELVARRIGAHKGERRLLRDCVKHGKRNPYAVQRLVERGFLEVRDGGRVFVTNFERYQAASKRGELRGKTTARDPNATRTRPERDPRNEPTARDHSNPLPEGEGEEELREGFNLNIPLPLPAKSAKPKKVSKKVDPAVLALRDSFRAGWPGEGSPPWERYGSKAFVELHEAFEFHASTEPGYIAATLAAFFDDPSQARFGEWSPYSLAKQLERGRYCPTLAEQKASARAFEREHVERKSQRGGLLQLSDRRGGLSLAGRIESKKPPPKKPPPPSDFERQLVERRRQLRERYGSGSLEDAKAELAKLQGSR